MLSMALINAVCPLLLWANQAVPEEASPSPHEVESRALAERRKILRGEVVFRLEETARGQQKPTTTFHVFFDGDSIRCDVMQTLLNQWPGGRATHSKDLHKYVFTPKTTLWHANTVSPDGKGVAAYKMARNKTGPNGKPFGGNYLPYRLDPRLVGLAPCAPTLVYIVDMEYLLMRPDREDTSIAADVLDGVDTWRIEYRRKNGEPVKFWIAPSKGYSLLRASEVEPYGDSKIEDSIQCEVEQFGAQQIWYPSRVYYERKLDGEKVMSSTLTTTHAEFNQPIDAALFTMAGMDIPAGTMVVEQPRNPDGGREWNGKELVLMGRKSPTYTGPPSSRPWMWWIVSINLLVVSVLLMMFWARSRLRRRDETRAR